jgi:hypothetical protein
VAVTTTTKARLQLQYCNVVARGPPKSVRVLIAGGQVATGVQGRTSKVCKRLQFSNASRPKRGVATASESVSKERLVHSKKELSPIDLSVSGNVIVARLLHM